jgi:excinuclease UvrABC ATPase subunit
MYELVLCPHQGCEGGKVHSIVGFDIFCDDCPRCDGLGIIKRRVPENILDHKNLK